MKKCVLRHMRCPFLCSMFLMKVAADHSWISCQLALTVVEKFGEFVPKMPLSIYILYNNRTNNRQKISEINQVKVRETH